MIGLWVEFNFQAAIRKFWILCQSLTITFSFIDSSKEGMTTLHSAREWANIHCFHQQEFRSDLDYQIKYFNNNHVQLRWYIWASIQCGFGVDNNRFGLHIYFSHFWLKGKERFEPLWLLTLGFVIVVSIWLWDWQLYCKVDCCTTE